MRADRAGALIVVDALARGVQVGDALDAVNPRAASSLREGRLESALSELRLDPSLARVCAAWPRAGKPALARFDALPSRLRFTTQLSQTLAYLAVVLFIELVVLGVLRSKVFRLLEAVGSDFHVSGLLDVVAVAQGLVFLLLVPFLAWVVLGAVGWERLPGWARQLQRAKEAALGAALVDAGAPEDVRAEAHRGFRTLHEPGLGALELDELYLESKSGAEAALERFLVAVRVTGFFLLTLLALGLLVGVYGSLARFSWLS